MGTGRRCDLLWQVQGRGQGLPARKLWDWGPHAPEVSIIAMGGGGGGGRDKSIAVLQEVVL